VDKTVLRRFARLDGFEPRVLLRHLTFGSNGPVDFRNAKLEGTERNEEVVRYVWISLVDQSTRGGAHLLRQGEWEDVCSVVGIEISVNNKC
jgi:hypothetical protein